MTPFLLVTFLVLLIEIVHPLLHRRVQLDEITKLITQQSKHISTTFSVLSFGSVCDPIVIAPIIKIFPL